MLGLAVHQALGAHDLAAERRADAWWPRHTPRIGSLPANAWIAGTQTPASAGVHGPGDSTSALGLQLGDAFDVISSLRNTRTSSPSSPKYCTRLKVKLS